MPTATVPKTGSVREEAERKAAQAMLKARCSLMLGRDARSVFFAMLAMRLKYAPNWECETAAIDGKSIVYNPDWINGLDKPKVVGVLAHEILHAALLHHVRLGVRNADLFNVAADLAINSILQTAGYQLPDDGCFAGMGSFQALPPGESAEWYYAELQKTAVVYEVRAAGDPGGCGGVQAPKGATPADLSKAEAEMRVAVASATASALARGDMPQEMQRLLGAAMQPTVDWKAVLRQFVQSTANDDYTWMPPNRRYIHLGLMLPSLRSESLGRIVVAIDTSGSIGPNVLATFASEIDAIVSAYPCTVEIVWCDCAIQHVQHWTPADGQLKLEPRGGGGTSHKPVFDHVEQGDPATCVICLTDGMTEWPDRTPDMPVLWVMTTNIVAPFGQTVRINDIED